MFEKLLPLYFCILAGYLIGRFTRWNGRPVARVVIYFFAPIVVFSGVLQQPLTTSRLFLPALYFAICSTIGVLTFRVAKNHVPGKMRGILAYTGSSGNSGYFGFPLVVALHGPEWLGVAVLMSLGFMIFENSVGFYLIARGQFSVKESVRKLLRLPTLYAFCLSVVANFSGVQLSAFYQQWIYQPVRWIYSVLGMLVIGLGLSGLRSWTVSRQEALLVFGVKFIAWPAGVAALLALESLWSAAHGGPIFSPEEKQIMFLMSLVPFPANSVAFSMELKTEPQKIAGLVLAGTLFAMIYIPLVLKMVPF